MALKAEIVRGVHWRGGRKSARWYKKQASRARRLAWKKKGEDADPRCLRGWAD